MINPKEAASGIGLSRSEKAFPEILIEGPHFEDLVNTIGEQIRDVTVVESEDYPDHQLMITLKNDVLWNTWASPSSNNISSKKTARSLVLARAAAFEAARRWKGDIKTMGDYVNSRDLETRWELEANPHPWYLDKEATGTKSPIHVSVAGALRADIDELLQQAYPRRHYMLRLATSTSILAGVAASCALGPSLNPEQPPAEIEEVQDDQPADSDSQPDAPEAQPTPTEQSIDGAANVPALQGLEGVPSGFGGEGDNITQFSNSTEIQSMLNQNFWGPIVDGDGNLASLISSQDGGSTTCVFNNPVQIYSPFHPELPTPYTETLLEPQVTNNGVLQFGNSDTDEILTQTLSGISMNGYPEGWKCVQAFATVGNPDFTPGTLQIFVLDENNVVRASMPGGFAGDEDVELRWVDNGPNLFIDGQKVEWEEAPFVVASTETPPPSEDQELPTALPEGVTEDQAHIVDGNKLAFYGPDGEDIIIAEFDGTQWRPVEFSVRITDEDLAARTTYDNRWIPSLPDHYRLTDSSSSYDHELAIPNIINTAIIGIHFDEQGQLDVLVKFGHNMLRCSPDLITSINESFNVLFDYPESMTLEQIVELLEIMKQPTNFNIGLNTIAPMSGVSDVQAACDRYGLDVPDMVQARNICSNIPPEMHPTSSAEFINDLNEQIFPYDETMITREWWNDPNTEEFGEGFLIELSVQKR